MTYVRRIKINPIMNKTLGLQWQVSYRMSFNDFWFDSSHAPVQSLKQAFDIVKELQSSENIKVIV